MLTIEIEAIWSYLISGDFCWPTGDLTWKFDVINQMIDIDFWWFLLTNIDQLGIMGFDHIWSKINPETLPGLSPNLYYNEKILEIRR